MFTYDVIAVSNRALCFDFLGQIKKISGEGIPVILREKDLQETEYERLAKQVMEFCPDVILHSFIEIAKRLGCKRMHLPMPVLRTADLTGFETVGASTHSVEEAMEAQNLGAAYITAGHIFATDCKKGVRPRGLDFLKDVCRSVKIPVYAIGGITPENISLVTDAGAAGVCVMSGLMKCADAEKYVRNLRKMK